MENLYPTLRLFTFPQQANQANRSQDKAYSAKDHMTVKCKLAIVRTFFPLVNKALVWQGWRPNLVPIIN